MPHSSVKLFRKDFEKMIPQAKKNGLWGEIETARYYRAKGYEIVDANFRTRMGEVDIIASNGEWLVFCEVKTRGEEAMDTPAAFVDKNKQKRLVAAALQYVKMKKYSEKMRFDVAEVTIKKDGSRHIHLIENAFNGNDVNQFGV